MNKEELLEQADALKNQAKTKEAVKIYEQLLDLYEKEENWKMVGLIYQMIGVCYKENAGKALHWLGKAKELCKEHDLKEGYANTMREIAMVKESDGDYEGAEKAATESVELLKDCDDEASHGMSLTKLGLSQIGLHKYSEAEDNIIRGIQVLSQTDHWIFLMTAYGHLGELFLSMKNYRDALISLEKAAAVLEKQPDKDNYFIKKAENNGMIAHVYALWGDKEKSQEWMQKAMAILNAPEIDEDLKEVILKEINFKETEKLLKS